MRRRMLMQIDGSVPSADIVILTGELTETYFTMTTADKSAYEYKYIDADGVSHTEVGVSGTQYTLFTLPNSYVEINGEITYPIIGNAANNFLNSVEVVLNTPEKITMFNARRNSNILRIVNYENTNVKTIGQYTFQKCNKLKLNGLPSTITVIQRDAFRECRELELSELPSSTTSIGDNAFLGCDKITDIKILNTTQMVTSGTDMFNAGTTIRVPNALLSQYQADTNWSTYNLIGY